jgi:hypothetical protein
MPIIETLAEPTTPLSQGDILKGVRLFATRRAWQEGGGEPNNANPLLCLVLSRPCVAVRDDWLVVASIEKYKNKPPGNFESF